MSFKSSGRLSNRVHASIFLDVWARS